MPKTVRMLVKAGERGAVLASVEVADTLLKRAVGLMFRRSLPADTGMWLSPCGSIHTVGMRFGIDVVFLNKSGEILRLAPNVKPWRVCGPTRHAKTVIELPAGSIARTGMKVGDRLELRA